MDPEKNLEQQVNMAATILRLVDGDLDVTVEAARLAELVLAMNDWISRGGVIPKRWVPVSSQPRGPTAIYRRRRRR